MTLQNKVSMLGLAVSISLGLLTIVRITESGFSFERGMGLASWLVLSFNFVMVPVYERIRERRKDNDPSGIGLTELRITGR